MLGAGVVLLSGCAVPVPIQIASWALDGLSLIATEKSVSDHGISLVAQKDCAVWRGVVEGELCREREDNDVMVAANEPIDAAGAMTARAGQAPSSALAPGGQTNQQVIAERRMAGIRFSHAMARTHQDASPQAVAAAPAALAPIPAAARTNHAAPPVSWNPPLKPAFLDREPVGGIYFVIGSFTKPGNALRLSEKHKALSASMLTARLDGRKIYRVVVGPVEKGREKATHRKLRQAGLSDTWAMRVNPSDWIVASPGNGETERSRGELARLNQ